MVSSKWMSGESPSPLMFTAPLMPPWAHTEWERFTGTTEKRSTGYPASAREHEAPEVGQTRVELVHLALERVDVALFDDRLLVEAVLHERREVAAEVEELVLHTAQDLREPVGAGGTAPRRLEDEADAG